MQAGQRIARLDPGPERVDETASIKHPDARNSGVERGEADGAQRVGNVARAVPIDLSDEAQRQMQLIVALPAGARDPAHQCKQLLAVGSRRADGDEQAMHDGPTIGFTAR